MARTADGYRAFLHGLQKGCLSFRRRTVNLVGQDDIGEDRPAKKAEMAVFVENFVAGDIRGHQVGRELHAFEFQIEHFGDGADQQGFGKARYPDKQRVAVRKQRDDYGADDVILSDNNFGDFSRKIPISLGQGIDSGNIRLVMRHYA